MRECQLKPFEVKHFHINQFVWYNLYDSQPLLRFSLRLTVIQVVHTEL